jgi:hypothetical protein
MKDLKKEKKNGVLTRPILHKIKEESQIIPAL